MKLISIVLLSFVLTANIFAQNNSSEPLQLNRNFLVHSAGLPQEFLLFVPDSASQILFNPARALNFTTNFIYVNYLSDNSPQTSVPLHNMGIIRILPPGSLQKANNFNFPSLYEESFSSSKNPTFSAAALINIGGAKWLFELTNGINNYNNSNNLHGVGENTYVPITNYQLQTDINSQDYKEDATTTSLKISRVFQSGRTNFSVGLFGIINRDNVNSTDEIYEETYHITNNNDSTKFRHIYIDNEEQVNNAYNSRYVIGGEFTINHKFWDYLFSIDYQFGDNSQKKFTVDSSSSSDSSYFPGEQWLTSGSQNIITNDNHTSQKPSFVNINNYFRHLLNLITPVDNIFLSLNLFFSTGEISYAGNSNNIFSNYSGQSGSGDTSSTLNSDKFDVSNLGLTFSTGYALSKSFTDLFILSGIRFSGNLEHIENIGIIYNDYNEPAFVKTKSYPSAASFTLPLYLNYTVAKWFSVYGGLNYSYTYSRYKYEYSNTEYNYQSLRSNEQTVTSRGENINEGWQSDKSIYLGCELRHQSGLKIQLFINNDFALIRNWNVSVGYHF